MLAGFWAERSNLEFVLMRSFFTFITTSLFSLFYAFYNNLIYLKFRLLFLVLLNIVLAIDILFWE